MKPGMNAERVSQVLILYRSILRLGRVQVKLTDPDFFRKVLRSEFRRRVNSLEEFNFQLEVFA